MMQPETEAELSECICAGKSIRVRGAGSKPSLSHCVSGCTHVDVSRFTGIIEYEPSEFTISAKAATPLHEIREALSANGQFMPFDPPLIDKGATIGGTIAAGLSGPGQFRYGSIRDFVLHVRMFDGLGTAVRAGGKVVKNAAGFDIPKLMVGSLGRLGVMTEVTLKVFPAPNCRKTLEFDTDDFGSMLQFARLLACSPLNPEAIDLIPPHRIMVRIDGCSAAVEQLTVRFEELCKKQNHGCSMNVVDDGYWHSANHWDWIGENDRLIKIPLPPQDIPKLGDVMNQQRAPFRLSAAGNVAWIQWSGERPILKLEELLVSLDLSGLVVAGETPRMRLGNNQANTFADKIKQAMDPRGVLGPLDLTR